ncbi:Fe-S oxidoreductase [Ectothiorhodospira haloalkaliphila]|uniref:Fe-S oxidoreductase n=1 Tax=Ectothiorhodospira haloalkaliphila TaxID=421628 RepID=W8KSI4_9GAMM|nr:MULTISPECIES: DUF1987 domain-containing protein [Ectothiorhodospira]AHK79987.1 Fe-S oxidoreductase [Ectothiorhodospira haloalkaliphila]MCG5493630.1 DUF1987 domain-containing protein [Ectothiorhodospira variabilis]MCG5496978.1 DUF1987 domain-containing protein [Ectothiorhodospira variabilis]MCG5502959.1 DUF1987 domain-containing protein [Ectothiorhodospira variabilis]MCG5506253.1 DUF1987 domain-containing protein [Ectothiorhodospira variabilis]
MDNRLYIPASPDTPEVDFDFEACHLRLRGESYPESAVAFYHDILERTRAFLEGCKDTEIQVTIELKYFNSSSTKMLFNLVDMLNYSIVRGNHIRLNWIHDEDDETILEFGQELAEDFPDIDFRSLPTQAL